MKELKSKVILLGDVNVGKTSIILRYFENKFSQNIENTIGTAFFTKYFPDEAGPSRNVTHKMNVWDTCGQERFVSIASVYYKDANVVIFVVDCKNPHSLKQAELYLGQVRQHSVAKEFFILCVNKVDLLSRYERGSPISLEVMKSCAFYDEIKKFEADNHFKKVFWTSSKDDVNISEVFNFIDEAVETKKISLDVQSKNPNKMFIQSITRDNNPLRQQGGYC